ncbi:hypothetical protein J4E91_007942 [Alternaria rosae]|nr:hypothetical protein J4E91_007942 [Alternaria rosae]
MEQWLSQKASAGDNTYQECTKILSDSLSSTTETSPASAAEALLHSVNASSKPADTGFEVTNLLLDTIAQFPSSHSPIIALLPAIRAISPSPNPVYYHLESMHRENYDGISGLRYLWKPEDKEATTTPGDRWVNYNVFTVKLATSGFDDGYFIFGFFCLRETLETNRQLREAEFEKHIRPSFLERSAIDAEELLNYDLTAAAKWVIIGASHMYRLGNSVFGEGLQRGIAVKTDFWNGEREPGLSWGRWLLWQSRFEYFAGQLYVKEEVRVLCNEAVAAIGNALFPKVD